MRRSEALPDQTDTEKPDEPVIEIVILEEDGSPLGELPSSPESYLTQDDRKELRDSLEAISRRRREAESQSGSLRIG
jgi:hypothetical protein